MNVIENNDNQLPSLDTDWIPPVKENESVSVNKIIPVRIGQFLNLNEVLNVLEYYKGSVFYIHIIEYKSIKFRR